MKVKDKNIEIQEMYVSDQIEQLTCSFFRNHHINTKRFYWKWFVDQNG